MPKGTPTIVPTLDPITLLVTVASPLAWMAARPALIRPPSLVTLTVVASMADEFPWMVPVLLLTVALFNAAIPVLVTDAISPELVTIASLALIEKLPEIVPAFSTVPLSKNKPTIPVTVAPASTLMVSPVSTPVPQPLVPF